MLNRVDLLVASLETKEKEIEAIKSVIGRTEEEKERDDENLVTVQELIDAVTKLQGTPDESKLEQISEVSLTSSYNFLIKIFVTNIGEFLQVLYGVSIYYLKCVVCDCRVIWYLWEGCTSYVGM